ncbi:beta strand repeat-containing protein [Marivivens marinus]|uniref:beta strand repeat-containing protein n=1 Tax=Marivivens marinus TaxID=3110173 RepID=UPI003B8474BF
MLDGEKQLGSSARIARLFQGTSLTALLVYGMASASPVFAADLTWDPRSTGNGTVNLNADDDWNTTDDEWDNGGSASVFTNGDHVTFEDGDVEGSGTTQTVDVTEDVAPGSITFQTGSPSADFIINSNGGSILSSSGTFAANTMQIIMNDTAEIGAGLSGAFIVTGSEQLTLSGASPSLTQLTVNAGADVFVTSTGDLAGSISNAGTFASEGTIGTLTTWSGGSATLEGTATTVIIHNGATVDISANNSAGLDVGSFTLGSGVDLTLDSTTGTLTTDTFSNYGDVTVGDGGTLTMDGGTNPFNNISGTLDVQENGTLDGDVTHGGTTMTVAGSVTGDVAANANGLTINGTGDVGGTVTVADTVTVNAEGGAEVGGITIESGGNFTLSDGGTVTVSDTGVTSVDIQSGGTLENGGGGTATLEFASDATMDVAGTITGGADTFTIEAGTVNLLTGASWTGDVQFVADVNSNVAVTFDTYSYTLGGDWTNLAGGSLTVDIAMDTDGNALVNNADDAEIDVNATLTGNVTNTNGTVNISSSGDVTGVVNNSDALNITTGTAGSIVNTSTGTVEVTSGGFVDTTIDNAGMFNVNSGTLTVDGLTTNENGGTINIDTGAFFAGDITNEAGGTLNVDGQVNGSGQPYTVNNSGTMTLAGTIAGNLDNSDAVDATYGLTIDGASNITGTLTNSGEALVSSTLGVTGGVTNESGGVLTINNSLSANVTNDSGGTINTDGTGQITGTLETAGAVEVEATEQLTVTGGTTVNNGGQVDLGGTLASNVTVESGGSLVTTSATAQVTGTLESAGTVDVGAGEQLTVTVDPLTIQNGGALELGGTVAANVDIEDGGALNINSATAQVNGTLAVDGTAAVDAGEQLTVSGLTTVEDGGDFDVAGTFNGDLTVDSGGTFDLNGGIIDLDGSPLALNGEGFFDGTVTGALTIGATGDATIDGATGVSGAIINNGLLTADAGLTWLTMNSSNSFVINGVTVGTGSGLLTNSGTITMNGGSIGSAVNNTGTIEVDGTATLTAGISGGGSIDLGDGAVGDQLTVSGGPANLNGATFVLDLDVGAAAGSDQIFFSGISPTGTVDLDFNVIPSVAEELASGLVIIDSTVPFVGFTATTDDLESIAGAYVYFLNQDNAAGEVRIESAGNPNIGGLAGAVVLTQSLIGSVVNRPSSPFVAGLAIPGDDPCGVGAWGRATGGVADAGGTTSVNDGALNVSSDINAQFGGVQLGADFSCFGGYYNGWDLSFGGILGMNVGATTQPLYAIDSSGAANTSVVLSNNSADFVQTYAGAYLSAFKGRSLVDLQYRFEQTQFDLENDQEGNPESAGILNQTFDSQAQTLSGSYSYVLPISEDRGINLVPTAGFAISQTTTDSIALDLGTLGDTSDDGRLEIDDFTSEIGFVGGTVSMTRIQPSGNSALTYFGTATYYKDFAGDIASVIYDSSDTETDTISSPNLGQYGEISFGVNYTRLLDGTGSMPNARQLNASVRVDGRFSETLESWGVTGQVRLQF